MKSKLEKKAELIGLLEKLKALEIRANHSVDKFNDVVYADLSPIVLKKQSKVQSQQSWIDKINNTKIIRSAKRLQIGLDRELTDNLVEVSNNLVQGINKINPSSKLTPKIASLQKVINKTADEQFNFLDKLYEEYLPLIFAQGRFHQTLFNGNSAVESRFTINTPEIQNLYFDFYKQSRNEFNTSFGTVIASLNKEIKILVNENIKRADLNEFITLKSNSFSSDLKIVARNHIRNAYLAGNIAQLMHDKVKEVVWQTGQHHDDCGYCRAIQVGDMVLMDENNNILPNRNDFLNFICYYDFPSVVDVLTKQGFDYFNHSGCRCSFVPH